MSEKRLPFDLQQAERLAAEYGTPLYIYDEQAMRDNLQKLFRAFEWAAEYKEYFAVKANPNPHLLKILQDDGVGADCSSLAELILAERAGITGENIVFTSNDTPADEFMLAKKLGAIINLDDISHIDYLEQVAGLPEFICFRYNPGRARTVGNSIIGNPEDAKYGMTKEQLLSAVALCRDKGVKRFGLHTMVVSNELNNQCFTDTARMMFDLVAEVNQSCGVKVEMVNFGGGIGIPYRPEQKAVNLEFIGQEIRILYEKLIAGKGLSPLKICHECGRMITGPYGYLLTRVLHKKNTYKQYIGVDACMANLMRPGMYGAYHHITVLGKEKVAASTVYDVTGSLCENNDKFAIDRKLPVIDIGDLMAFHDAGAHGYAMGFNYNGKLKCPEILLRSDGSNKLIRRAETIDDYFATLNFDNLGSG